MSSEVSPALLILARDRLAALGYGAAEPDLADLTPLVRALQADFNVDEDGELGPETWAALLSTERDVGPMAFGLDEEAPPDETLPPGGTGPLVDEVRLRLRALGAEIPTEPDNGPLLQAAIRAFQERLFLATTGGVDADTLWALRAETAEVGPLFAFATAAELEDQSGGPLAFGLASREVDGDGGYVYRQYDDGSLEIVRTPKGGVPPRLLTEGAAWRAITAEIGPYPAESKGATGSGPVAARDLQARLNELGFGPLAEDGKLGPGSAAAIRRFQTAAGIQQTGVADPATLAKLDDPWPILRLGASGEEVKRIQERLIALGHGPLVASGAYDEATAAAVRKLQRVENLPDTGELDAISRGHLLGAQTVDVPDATVQAERDRLLGLAEAGVAHLEEPAKSRVLAVLREAVRWFGLREIPKGSNGGPQIGPITAGFVKEGAALPPWCALAVSHWLKTGLGAASWAETPVGFRNASALAFGAWGEKKGRLLPASGPAPSGSIMVMYRQGSGSDAAGGRAAGQPRWEGTGHTGLVIADLGDKVLTLDGNVSDRCWTATRPRSVIIGYVTWW